MIAEEVLVELEANVPGLSNPRITCAWHDSTREWHVSFMGCHQENGHVIEASELVAASAPVLSDAFDKCLIQAAHARRKPVKPVIEKPRRRSAVDLLG